MAADTGALSAPFPELFRLDDGGNPTVVAGVPPDYFSATGQLWGNPLYRWDAMAGSGYQWWIDRIRATYRDGYDRLVEVKKRHDPTNLFHVNQNIRPA